MARIAETEEVLTIEPPFAACKGSITAFMPRNTPSWLTRKCCSNSAALGSTWVFGLKKAGGVAEFGCDMLTAFLDVGNRDPRALGHQQPCLGFPLTAGRAGDNRHF